MKLPNGYGSVVKLSGKRRKPFAARVTVGIKKKEDKNGKITYVQDYKYIGYFLSRAEAFECLANYNANKVDNSDVVENLIYKHSASRIVPTFKNLADEWYERKEKSNKNYSESTLTHYRSSINRLNTIWDVPVNMLDYDRLQPIIDSFRDKSKSTLTEIKTVLTGVLDYAMLRKFITTNYATLCEYNFTKSTEKLHKPYSNEEIAIIWSHQEEFIAQLILITIYTGMRPTELLTIKNEDIDLDNRIIIGGIKTKAGKRRHIPIHNRIFFIISELKSNNKYLVNNNGKNVEYRQFLDDYREFCKRIRISYHTPHDGRHTCATELENRGVSLLLRQRILGHSSNNVTEDTYTSISDGRLVEAINLINFD